MDVFCHPKFQRGSASQNCTHIVIPTEWHITWKNFIRLFSLAAKIFHLIFDF